MEYLNLKCPKCGHVEPIALNGWAKVCCVACHAVITSKQAAQQKFAQDGGAVAALDRSTKKLQALAKQARSRTRRL